MCFFSAFSSLSSWLIMIGRWLNCTLNEQTNKQTNPIKQTPAMRPFCVQWDTECFFVHTLADVYTIHNLAMCSQPGRLMKLTLHGEISEFWFVYLMRSWGLRKCTWEWTRVTEQSGFHCMCQVQAKLAGFELACEVREQCGSVYFWERSNWWGWARRQITGSHVAMCVCECVWVCSMCTLHVRV